MLRTLKKETLSPYVFCESTLYFGVFDFLHLAGLADWSGYGEQRVWSKRCK